MAIKGGGATMPGVRGLLANLLYEIDEGLLITVVDDTRAETFDNFLDHSEAYLNKKCYKEAGVIAGVVFEDTIRRICEKHAIPERGKKPNTLLSKLAKENVIAKIQAKRAQVAAAVRTSATHARWKEFSESDVQETIELTRRLLEERLGG